MMTTDQAILFTILGLVFVFLVWGRWRYDIVAFSALLVALIAGVVPTDDAFSGFGHPATVIVALVLVISRGLSSSGAIELLARHVIDSTRSLHHHIGIMATLSGTLSAVMNNVAALALLMPLDIEAARKAGRSPAASLMPLSFASILGGLATLIGTPPNIIISAIRERTFGEPFGMFDFTPVGGIVAAVGIVFVVMAGWRLIPDRNAAGSASDRFKLKDYVAELIVPDDSKAIGRTVAELGKAAAEEDARIIGIVRHGFRMPRARSDLELRAGDVLVIESGPSALDKLTGALDLHFVSPEETEERKLGKSDLVLSEAVVPQGALIEGRSADQLALLAHQGVTLLGISRQGRGFRERVRRQTIKAGDVLLLLGPAERLGDVIGWLGCLPLAERGLEVVQRQKAGLAVALFAGGIMLATAGVIYLPVALACTAVLMVLFGIVPLRQIYESIEWPVIVLLGSMIPIGAALESTGGTGLLASMILSATQDLPAWTVLLVLMLVTMSLSDVMNNTATAVIAAPVAIDVAGRLGVSADPFLMAIAVAASCAFLTPIGHKNNMLVLGPGGYRFGDYWRLGLPLEILIVVVSIPLILLFWPL